MSERSEADAVKRAIVAEAQSDIVGLWAIHWEVRQRMPRLQPRDAKSATLAIVAEVLGERSLVAGEFRDRDEATAVFEPWSLGATESVARISAEWDALGREPNLGDIVWLVDPRLLPVTAARHPLGSDWSPPKSEP